MGWSFGGCFPRCCVTGGLGIVGRFVGVKFVVFVLNLGASLVEDCGIFVAFFVDFIETSFDSIGV